MSILQRLIYIGWTLAGTNFLKSKIWNEAIAQKTEKSGKQGSIFLPMYFPWLRNNYVASKIEPLSRVRFFGFSTGRFFRRAYFNPNLNANLTTLTTFRPRCFFPLTQTIKAVTLALYSIQQLFIRDIHTKLVSLTVSISRYWTKLRGGVSRFPNFWLNCL